jgi:hypothetical protein
MFGTVHTPLATRAIFLNRLARAVAVAVIIIAISLSLGVAGYHWIAGFGWTDAFLNASMILGGMGPVNPLITDASKMFAALYALFSGLVLVGATGVVLGPILHRMLHRFHLDDVEQAGDAVRTGTARPGAGEAVQ